MEDELLELLQEDTDDKEIQYRIGLCYLNGVGITADQETGYDWIRKSANQNYEPAMKLLSSSDKNDIRSKIDEYNSLFTNKLYELAETDDCCALFVLFKRALNKSSIIEAKDYLDRLSKLNCSEIIGEAYYLLAEELDNKYHQSDETANIDKSEIFTLYSNASEQGYYPAYIKLANCFFNGFGTDINHERSLFFREKAAEFDTNERINLAFEYLSNQKTTYSPTLFVIHAQKAISQEDFNPNYFVEKSKDKPNWREILSKFPMNNKNYAIIMSEHTDEIDNE